jgi:hypothetical protein
MAVVGWVAWKWPQTRRLQTLHGLEPIVYDDPANLLAPAPITPSQP